MLAICAACGKEVYWRASRGSKLSDFRCPGCRGELRLPPRSSRAPKPQEQIEAGAGMTVTQTRDLLKLYRVWQRTHGTYNWGERGEALRLRTGKSLTKLELAEWGNQHSRNRSQRWWITAKGIELAKEIAKTINY